jgi:hypothetical protein
MKLISKSRWPSATTHGCLTFIYYEIVIIFFFVEFCSSLHLKGTFDTNELFKFLTRFGFQSTNMHNQYSTQGHIYGNITLIDASERFNITVQNNMNGSISKKAMPAGSLIMLTVMDYSLFHRLLQ